MKQHPKTSGGGGLSKPLGAQDELNATTPDATGERGDISNASDDARTFKVESDQNSNNNENSPAQGAGSTGASAQVAGTVPLPADGASDAIASIVSDGLVFKVLDNSIVELIGAAAIPPKDDFSLPATVTSGSITYEVTALAKDAFAHCPELTSISLPATLREVDPDALKGCTSLKSISISTKSEAFASSDGMLFTKDYSKLLLIPEGKEGAAVIPGKTSSVPTLAFFRCQGIPSLIVGDGGTALSSFDGMLFTKDMKTLIACTPAAGTAVVLPTETEAIGEHALAGCKNLASITALGNVREINSKAFADEVKASAVVALPAGENYDDRKAVWEAAGFQHFAEPAKPGVTTRPDANQEVTSGLTFTLLDDYTLSVAWEGKDDPAAELDIPASAEINDVPYRVSTMAENAFANRGSLTSVKLPSTITTINNGAFAGCANLATIEFPNTLRTIGERAFEATSIKDVWLPTSIETIGSRAFASCSALERIVALGTPEVASEALAGCTNTSIYIPSGSEDSWNPGLPSDNNHLMPYGVSLSEEPLTIEAGQEANLLEGGNLQAPDPVETSYSYAATPVSVDAGTVSAKKAGTTDITAVLTLDNRELTRATRSVEVSPNPEAEANVSLLNSETPLPSTYLADLRAAAAPMSVAAPISVVFGANGYDVSKPATSVTASATFTNASSTPAYIESLTCTDTGASNLLEPKSGTALASQKLFGLYPGADTTKTGVTFGYGSGVNSASPASSMFFMGGNTEFPCTFTLNLNNATVKTSAANGGATVQSLANVMYTYKAAPPLGVGLGTTSSDFYLKDKNTGQVYTAAQVKEHANAIASGNKTIEAAYRAFITNENTYECKTKWRGALYDVRVIGINHDDLATATGGRTKAGLTFQFKNLLGTSGYPMNTSNTNSGGWGSSALRTNMNSGAIWSMVPTDLQSQIVTVKKYYGSTYNSTSSAVSTSNDKLFLASYFELMGSVYSGWSSYAWLANEGTQYEYWNGKAINDYGGNAALKKGYQATPSTDVAWWERSVRPTGSTLFFDVHTNGDPSLNGSASGAYGVCPCFCL